MAFIFSTSHLPDLERPAEEEDDDMKPMPRAGGVRAFSHLPQPVRAQADASPLWGRGMAQLPPRSASPTSPAPSDLRDQDDPPPPEAGLDEAPDTGSQEPEASSPWYMPRLSAKDLLPQGHDEDTPDSSLNGPALKPWEKPARSSGFDGTQPEDRSATSPRSSGFAPSLQDLRDDFDSPAPGSPVGQAPAQDNSTALPGGRLFEQRSAPAAFVMQQMGKTASGPPQQQRLQGSQQVLAAQQQGRGANPPAQDGRLAAQQKPGGVSTTPPGPQASKQGQPAATQNAADAQKKPQTEPGPQTVNTLPQYRSTEIAKDKEIEDLKNASPAPAKEIELQRKYLQQLKKADKPSKSQIKQAETKLSKMQDPRGAGVALAKKERAVITRSRESLELAAQFINLTRKPGENLINPDAIDEDSAEHKTMMREAIKRLHSGTAPWLDNLADVYGENEMRKDGEENESVKNLLKKGGSMEDAREEPWCGHALSDAMKRAKIPPPQIPSRAGSWNQWGAAGGLNIGDVYHISYPKGGGHVTTVLGVSKDGTQVFCLGGNQNGALNISAYPISTFQNAKVVFRKPNGQKNNLPAPVLDYHADPASFSILSGLTR
jgi:hypothetical protein